MLTNLTNQIYVESHLKLSAEKTDSMALKIVTSSL